MVLVVALTRIDVDEMVLDSSLHASRHVVIHGDDSGGHANGLVVAKLRTVGTLHLGIIEVDAIGVNPVCRCVTA